MNLEDLFDECADNTKYDVAQNNIESNIEKLTREIESNYQGLSTVYADREKEKEELNTKILAAEKKLKEIKNPKNMASLSFTKREVINKKLAESRVKIRNEIARYKVRLDEIKVEEGDNKNEKNNVNNAKTNAHSDTTNSASDIVPNKWNMNPYGDLL
jgi:chromosome segregation ATPase